MAKSSSKNKKKKSISIGISSISSSPIMKSEGGGSNDGTRSKNKNKNKQPKTKIMPRKKKQQQPTFKRNSKGPQFSLFGPLPGANGSIKREEKKEKKKNKKKNKNKKVVVEVITDDIFVSSNTKNKKKEKKNKLKKNKNKKAKTAFTHSNLPDFKKFVSMQGTPWYDCQDDYSQLHYNNNHNNNNNNNNNSKKRQRPDDNEDDDSYNSTPSCAVFPSFSELAMSTLDKELEQFAAYVRLRSVEHQARQLIIQRITDQAGDLFGQDIHLQVFGSYASPEICTFSSDVDIALWGVVPPDDNQSMSTSSPLPSERLNQHVRFYDNDNGNGNDNDRLVPDPQHQQRQRDEQEKAKQRELRIQRWRDAIDTQTANINRHQQQQQSQYNNIEIDSSNPGELFELDRVGQIDDTGADIDADVGNDADANANADTIDLTQDAEEDDHKVNTTGTRYQNPIELIDSDSNDSANPLEHLHSRHKANRPIVQQIWDDDNDNNNDDDDDDDDNDNDSDYTEGENDTNVTNYGTMEVMFHSAQKIPTVVPPPTIGPTGETRNLVLKALNKLSRSIRRYQPWLQALDVRRRARVPIVNMVTTLGFESDLAIGGHNGADTSKFAAAQSNRYKSFATVVLILKLLLNHHDLDKPFTGGLGSFKLYVMLAYHIDQHLKMNGNDRPGEILLTFLYRFGYSQIEKPQYQTKLELHTVLSIDDYSADMTSAHRLDQCLDLFGTCLTRLSKKLDLFVANQSLVASCLIQHHWLQQDRNKSLQLAGSMKKSKQQRNQNNNNNKSPVSFPRRQMWPSSSSQSQSPPNNRRKVSEDVDVYVDGDADESKLLQGYNVTRGPRGGLVPLQRPDIEKKPSQWQQMKNMLSNKNRKNKKKQKRDKAIKAIASESFAEGNYHQNSQYRKNTHFRF